MTKPLKLLVILSLVMGGVLAFLAVTRVNKAFSSQSYPFSTGSLVNDHGTIYFIRGTNKNGFANLAAFLGLGYKLSNVISGDTSAYALTGYVISQATQAHPWGTWVVYKGTVYYVHQSGLIGVPSAEVFYDNGGDFRNVVPANAADVATLNANAGVAALAFSDSRVYGGSLAQGSNQPILYPAGTWQVLGANIYNLSNVGIGTQTPSEKLEVAGNVKANGLCLGADCRTSWPTGSVTNVNNTNASQWTTSGANIYYNGGSVAIGRPYLPNSESARLVVDQGTDSTPTMWSGHDLALFGSGDPSTGNNTYLSINRTAAKGGSTFIQSFNSGIGGAALSLNPGGGNVGIGTTNPGDKLHIVSKDTDAAIKLEPSGIPVKGRILAWGGDPSDPQHPGFGGELWIEAGTQWSQGSAAPIRFSGMYGAPVYMSIIPNGNVGIGTVTPSQTLDVAGAVQTTGYFINGQQGLTKTITVSAPAGSCTLTFTSGLLTATTCP